MPKYEVTSPDGRRYEVDTGDQQASQDELISHIQSQSQAQSQGQGEDWARLYRPGTGLAETAVGIGVEAGQRTPARMGRILSEIPGQVTRGAQAVGQTLDPSFSAMAPAQPSDALGLLSILQGVTLPAQAFGGEAMQTLAERAGGRLKADLPGMGEMEWAPEEAGQLGEILGAGAMAPLPAFAGARALGSIGRAVAPEARILKFIDNLKAGMPKEMAAAEANAAARATDELQAHVDAGAPRTEGQRFPQAEGMLADEMFEGAKVPGPAGEQMRLPDTGMMPSRAPRGPGGEQLSLEMRSPDYAELDQWLGRPFAREAELTGRMQGAQGEPFPQTKAALQIERKTGELPESFLRGSRGADIDIREAENLERLQGTRFPRAAGALREEARGGELAYRPITGGKESEFDRILREAGLDPSPVTRQGKIAKTREAREAAGRPDTPSEEFAASTEAPGGRRKLGGPPEGVRGPGKRYDLPSEEGRPDVDEAAALVNRLQKADAESPGQWTDIPSLSGEANTILRKSVFGLQGSGVIETQKLPDGRRQIRIAQEPQKPISGGAERFPTAAKFIEAEVQKTLRDFDKAQVAAKLTRPIGGGAEQFPSAAKMLEEEAVTLAQRNESLSNILYSSWVAFRLAGKAVFNNFLYNIGLMGIRVGDTAIEAGRQKVRQLLTGQAPVVTFKEVKADITGMVSALPEARKAAMQVFRGGPSMFASTSKLEAATTRFPKWMQKVGFALPGKLLISADEWAKTVNYKGKAHALLVRKIQKEGTNWMYDPTKLEETRIALNKIDQMAMQEADLKTLTSDLDTSWEDFRRGLQGHAVGRYLAPFMRTNVNDLYMALEHTPGFGFLISQSKSAKGRFAGLGTRGDPEITRFSKQTLGMLSGIAAYWMAHVVGGKITGGGPTDPGARALAQETPYSIQLGGHQMAYDRMGTFGRMLSLMANSKDLWDNIDQEDAGYKAIKNLAAVLMDVPALDGMEKMADALDDPKGAGIRYLQSWAASTAPAFLSQGYQMMDPRARKPGTEAPYLGVPEAMGNAWLGPMGGGVFLRDVWGQPVERERLGVMGKPFANDPLDIEMRRLAQATGKGVMPPRKDLEGLRLDEKQYDELIERSGGKARLEMERTVTRGYYKAANDEEKLRLVRQTFSDARDQARGEMLRRDRGLRKQLIDQAREEVRKYRTPSAPGKALEKRREEQGQ